MRTQGLLAASLVGVLLAASAPIANAKRRRRSGGQDGGHGNGKGGGKPYQQWAPPQPPPPPTRPQTIDIKPPTAGEKYNYGQLLYLSMLYYEAQRSGPLPGSNRIPWRRDANVDDPVPGGWYDAGDFIKFSWTNAYAATVLAWGFLEWSDAYDKAGETENLYQCIRWPLDYLLKAHTGTTEFVVQVGDGGVEHSYWGRPELETLARPALKVDIRHAGSEPPAEAAAAMAAGYLVFKDHDPAYAQELLLHGRRLFDFAYKHQAQCQVSAPYYQSTGYLDELAYAAAWLYKATGEKVYLEAATTFAHKMVRDVTSPFSWENKSAAVYLLMFKLTGDVTYADNYKQFMKNFKNSPKTPHGLYYYQEWGPLRYTANTAFLALLAADFGIDAKANRQFARSQIHYIVGDNGNGSGNGFSYIIGFNKRFPKAPHHRTASCGKDGCLCTTDASAFTVYGALVGGPDANDQYRDDCQNYKQAEVAIDYNAGFQSAVAGLKHLSNMGLLATF